MNRSQKFGWMLVSAGLGVISCADAGDVAPSEPGVHKEMLEPSDIVGALDGRLIQFPCSNNFPTDDCSSLGWVVNGVVTGCSGGVSEMLLDHPVAGTPGAPYAVTMHLYGIMEPKFFGVNATREAAPGAPQPDGGNPTPWATAAAGAFIPPSTYSAYEIRVLNQFGAETARYYLNADISEGHRTLRIDYVKTIQVVGGGVIRLRRHDSGCQLIKNCGTQAGYPCETKARMIDLLQTNPLPPVSSPFPAGFNQPQLNKTMNHGGQWWFIDVTAVQAL